MEDRLSRRRACQSSDHDATGWIFSTGTTSWRLEAGPIPSDGWKRSLNGRVLMVRRVLTVCDLMDFFHLGNVWSSWSGWAIQEGTSCGATGQLFHAIFHASRIGLSSI